MSGDALDFEFLHREVLRERCHLTGQERRETLPPGTWFNAYDSRLGDVAGEFVVHANDLKRRAVERGDALHFHAIFKQMHYTRRLDGTAALVGDGAGVIERGSRARRLLQDLANTGYYARLRRAADMRGTIAQALWPLGKHHHRRARERGGEPRQRSPPPRPKNMTK